MKYPVRVYPRASKEEVLETADGLKVYLRQSPTDGQANEALRKILGAYWGVAKSRVVIVQGEKSRNKLVQILS